MKNIICHECGAENEPQYIYCKNCGASLRSDTAQKNADRGNTQSSVFGSNYGDMHNQSQILNTVENIPIEDIAIFTGKKSGDILPKFTKMELTGSKVSWCWPVAILSFFFGPLGAAIWFFYRKMYKEAAIFTAIGIITSTAIGLLAGLSSDMGFIWQNAGEGLYGDFYNSMREILGSELSVRQLAANAVETAVNIITMIVTGLFGFYFYKKHTVKSINRYQNMPIDPQYYRMGLYSIGGTSSGMAVLGVAIMIFAENSVDWIIRLLNL